MDADKLARLKAKGIEPTTVHEMLGVSEHQTILNKWGVPHQEHQDIVHEAEAAWLAVIDKHIESFSPVDKRIFLSYAMFGVSVACSSRIIITGIVAKQAAREHKEQAKLERIVQELDKKYGSPEEMKQAIEDEYGDDDG